MTPQPPRSVLDAPRVGSSRSVIAILLIALAFICFVIYASIRSLVGTSTSQVKSAGAIAATSSSAEQIRASNERATALRRLSAASSPYEKLLADCKSVVALSLPKEASALCRTAHTQAAREYVKLQKYAEASGALNAAVNEGLEHAAAEQLQKAIDAGMGRERERSEKEREKLSQAERVAYGVLLRDRFLDKGMDVKVSVTGRQKDRITLTWVLMSDVWTHQMKKPTGVVAEMKQLGFRRVDAMDGYDYHVYWDWTKEQASAKASE